MPALTSIIAGVGIAAGLAGAGMSYYGSRQATAAYGQDEAIRQQAMNLDAQRRQRQLIREGAQSRANATSGAVNQGAQFGSGLAGGLGQVTGQQTSGMYYNQTSQTLGNQLFASNRNLVDAQSMSNTGTGLSSLGGTLIKDKEEFGRGFNYAFS